MFENLRKDIAANSKNINYAGVRALQVYHFGRWRMNIKTKALRAPLSYIYRLMERHVRFKYGIELPYTVELGRRVIFEHQHGIVIHGHAKIGDDCIIRQGVTIGNKSVAAPHDAPTLGHHVNIGAGAKILGKVRIGNYVDIGANAVVVADVEDNAVVVGVPARVVKVKDVSR